MKNDFVKWSTLWVAMFLLTSCTLATVRTIEEDRIAKEGFNADHYVASIWENEFLPTIEENAIDIGQLLEELDQNEDSAIEKYGNRTSTGPYSFMVEADVQIVGVDRESRVGLAELDLLPADGEVDVFLAIGPVLRGNALRDAVGFIAFNDFTNQVEFAQVSDALKSRIDADVLSPANIDDLVGQNVHILGAFTFDDRDEIVIMPVRLEVIDG
jgi:predicted lipoprotein